MIAEAKCDVCGEHVPMVKKGKGWSLPNKWLDRKIDGESQTVCSRKCFKVRIPSSYRVPERQNGCRNCKHQDDATSASMLGRYCLKNIKYSDFRELPRLSKNELNVDWDGFGICDEHEKESE